MEGYTFKNTPSLSNLKKPSKFKSTSMSFSSENESSIHTINDSSPKISYKLNNNNINNNSLYSFKKNNNNINNNSLYSFKKTNNNKSNLTIVDDSKKNININLNNISDDNSLKYLKNYSPKFRKTLFYGDLPYKSLNNNSENKDNNQDNSSNLNNNSGKYIVFNNKKQTSLRNGIQKLNSGYVSTVKEEQEQNSKLVDNNNNNIINNNPNSNNNIQNVNTINSNMISDKYKIQIFYEGKYINLTLNRNDKFKKLILMTQKKLFPYHQIINYDFLYKLKTLDIINSFNMKLSEIIGDIPNNKITTFLLRKKNNVIEKKKGKGTTVTIESFPSLTDLANDLNYFFKKETRESDFIVDYKKNVCKVIFSFPEKAFSLVAFLSKLKVEKPIYKRLKVNLDYKLKVITNVNKYKQKQPKIMLPLLKKKIIDNLKNNNENFYIKEPNISPSYRRKNIKLFLPNYFSFSKNNKNKGEEILFLYRKKQKQLNSVKSEINIKSYKDKDMNNNISDIKSKNRSKKILSLFDKDRKSISSASKKHKRNSVFYNAPIKIKINNGNNNNNHNSIDESNNSNKNNNNDSLNNEKNSNGSNSSKNIIIRSPTNKNGFESTNRENQDKKLNGINNNVNNSINNNINNNLNNNINISTINNNNNKNNNFDTGNIQIDESKKRMTLIKMLSDAKISDSSSSSSEGNSSDSKILKKISKKSLFKNKNKEFMFFNGLTKREKRKYNKYIGKKE